MAGNKEAVKVILETSSSSLVSDLVKSLIHKRLDFIMFMLAKLASSSDSIKVYNNFKLPKNVNELINCVSTFCSSLDELAQPSEKHFL